MSSSSVLAYLGNRGFGQSTAAPNMQITVYRNAVPFLALWDIYKNYYANKQEEIGAVLHTSTDTLAAISTAIVAGGNTQPVPTNAIGGYSLIVTGYNLEVDNILITMKNQSSATDTFPIAWTDLIELEPGFPNFGNSGQRRGRIKQNNWTGKYIYSVTIINAATQNVEPQVVTFPLENIDTMRNEILSTDPGIPFEIDNNAPAPYGLPFVNIQSGAKISAWYSQEGLPIKTYQSHLLS